MPMTPRERILAVLDHQVPDRTPTDSSFHVEIRRQLLEHFKTDDWSDVLDELGIAGWGFLTAKPHVPEFSKVAEERTCGQLVRTGLWRDERTYQDEWGVVRRVGESGWYEEWESGPLVDADGEDLSAVESLSLPKIEDIYEPPDYAAKVARLKEQELFVEAQIRNPYKDAWLLRGMDNVLADYLINREFLEALYDRLFALYTEIGLREIRAGVDMISMWGDIAMQDRIIMGPDTWRQVDKPRLAKMVAAFKAEDPDLHTFIHSDGALTDLMDDLVEIGFNIINPIQPECMDPVFVKQRWGDRITMHGCVSIQQTLPFGKPEDCRAEVEHLIRKCGYNGGLVVKPSNAVQPGTPIENILACYHAARDFDVTSLGGKPG